MKAALSIAGSDCSGGAGIQADLKTFSALGVFGMSAVTSIVAENTVRVIEYQDARPDIIEKQIDAVFEDIPPDATKVGMLSCAATMEAVAGRLRALRPRNLVVDPVMYAKNGCALMDPEAVALLASLIVPLADVVTPNIPEAEKMAGMKIAGLEGMREAAGRILAMGCGAVVLKGGHAEGDAIDVLLDGSGFLEFPAPRIDTRHTHGTGCAFSSAIAACLALGLPLGEAVGRAKAYISAAIAAAPGLGKGSGPVHHFHAMRAG